MDFEFRAARCYGLGWTECIIDESSDGCKRLVVEA